MMSFDRVPLFLFVYFSLVFVICLCDGKIPERCYCGDEKCESK